MLEFAFFELVGLSLRILDRRLVIWLLELLFEKRVPSIWLIELVFQVI